MGDLINFVFDTFLDLVCFPLFGGGKYFGGFAVGLATAIVLGWLSKFVPYHRGRILYFFATIQPSLRPSPSGYTSMMGCWRSVFLLAGALLTFLFFACGVIYALSH